jgi:outer membrane protein assembly factor BamB
VPIAYVATDETLHAFDFRRGREVWSASRPGGPATAPRLTSNAVFHAGGTTAEGADATQVAAFDTDSGRRLWARTLAGAPGGTLAVRDQDRLLVPAGDRLVGLDADDGAVAWQEEFPAPVGAPVVGDSYVFVVDAGGRAHARRHTAGSPDWEVQVGPTPRARPPAYDGARLYVVGEDRLTSIEPVVGREQWRTALPAPGTAPAVAGDVIHVGDDAGAVRAYDSDRGRVLWERTTGGDDPAVLAPPTPTSDAAFVAAADGLHAYTTE